MGSAANWRKVKTHLTYTYEEAARVTDKHKRTVRAWVKNGLPVLTGQRPHIIRGCDLREFLRNKSEKQKTPLLLHEFRCFKCREAREPAGRMVDCNLSETGPGMLEGLCSVCMTVMFKRIARDRIHDLRHKVDVTVKRGDGSL